MANFPVYRDRYFLTFFHHTNLYYGLTETRVGLPMNIRPRLIVGIIILALLCSPGLAISTSELLSRYQTGGFWEPATPVPTPTLYWKGETGSISVWSDPPGAKVFLNGQFKGTTGSVPLIIDGVEVTYPFSDTAKSHQVTLTRAGYQDYTTLITLTAGETTSVGAMLTPIALPSFIVPTTGIPTTIPTMVPTTVPTRTPTTVPTISPTGLVPQSDKTGTVSVSSTPTGARVYLDGVDRGTTPVTITGVSPGVHLIRVTKSGYEDYSTGVFVRSGQTATVSITLRYPSGMGAIIPDPPIDIPSRKPNIYLYSEKDITARVRLAPEYAITVSEPAYQPGKGWQAEIRNGSLNGAGDFLFYEALVPDSGWQKEEGYIIRAADREQDMAFMLGEYGFNEKETGDFIGYWASHLIGDVDYVFYPQETDAVERVMPLSVSPKPDHVMRIWFYAEPLITAPKPVTSQERIIREGFYIVEWGVIIRDE
jgi:hypothetical protein